MAPYPPPPDQLVSDRERRPVVECLQQAFMEGRLTREELDQRLTLALTVRTHGELAGVMAGLPGSTRPSAPVNPSFRGAAMRPDDQSAAVLAHVLGAVTGFVGPLIMVLMMQKDRAQAGRSQAVEALNFQLSVLIAVIVTLGFGFFVLWPVDLIFSAVAAVHASKGQPYRYPFSIPFVR
jgi:uncharacterized Tic20 family protein